ncbi:glycoside hydrolase superfamily [Xylariales sp. AK1849]|nr:glycoside hydrolase superfamily [Xylariales sp. AK1849]
MMSLRRLCGAILATAGSSHTSGLATATWPNGPFLTSGRWITDASGSIVTYAGVNWPGHADTMIPEGLQYASIEDIVSKIKSIGMNSIRLTYAIEMIDQIEENGGNDVPVQTAFTDALGQGNGTAIYQKVFANNPSLGNDTTRLQVFDAVAEECANQGIYVHLDNHVSKAGWCCTPLDGNTWWGDTYFSVANWTRGLSYMADHCKKWPNLMSMSLRNELRQPLLNKELYSDSYNWQDWYKYVKQGADAIHSANADVLIFLSGLDSDTTLAPVVQGTALTPGSSTFNIDDFQGYGDKLVLELHNYANIIGGSETENCTALQEELFDDGFQTLVGDAPNEFPMVMTEFGFMQDATTWQDTFATCLEKYLAGQKVGWMIWPLSGSYYIREGNQDADEPWGLLTHDWSDWRSPEHITGGLKTLVNASLTVNGSVPSPGDGQSGNSSSNDTSDNSAAQLIHSTDRKSAIILLLMPVVAVLFMFI